MRDPRADRDRPAQIQEYLKLSVQELRLLAGTILIQANEEQTKIGSLYVPVLTNRNYPDSGWVIDTGRGVDEVKPGDFVLCDVKGGSVDYSYYDLFEIILRLEDGSHERIWADIESEPVVREFVTAYRKNQTSKDYQLSVADRLKGTSISFNCSDVVDWQIGEMANPSVDLDYVPVYMLYLQDEEGVPTLYYITKPANLLAIVEY